MKTGAPNTLWDTRYPKGHAEVRHYDLAEVPCDLLPFGQKEHLIRLTLTGRGVYSPLKSKGSNMTQTPSKVWRGIGVFLEVVAFAAGTYGLILFFTFFDVLRHNRLKFYDALNSPSVFKLASVMGQPFSALPARFRFLLYLVPVGLVALILGYMNSEIRRINRTSAAIVASLSAYIFAGAAFLCSVVFGVQWMVEIHLVGRIFVSIGLLLALFLIVTAGVKTEKRQFLVALLFAVITLPAQFVLLLPIYQFFLSNILVLIIVGLAALGVNLLIYIAAIKKKSD